MVQGKRAMVYLCRVCVVLMNIGLVHGGVNGFLAAPPRFFPFVFLLSFIRSFGRRERPKGQSCLNYDLGRSGVRQRQDASGRRQKLGRHADDVRISHCSGFDATDPSR